MVDQPVFKRRILVSWNAIMSRLPPELQESESTEAAFQKLEDLADLYMFLSTPLTIMKHSLGSVLGENNDLVPIILEILNNVG